MSSFIVNDNTINEVVSFLQMKTSADYYYPLSIMKSHYDLADLVVCEHLARVMFALNVDAVNERYEKSDKANELGFQFRFIRPRNEVQVLKNLECWLYQSATHPQGCGLIARLTSLSLKWLRYQGQDTYECMSQLAALSSGIKQVEGLNQCAGSKKP